MRLGLSLVCYPLYNNRRLNKGVSSLTERENFQLILDHKRPKWIPCFLNVYFDVFPSIINNSGKAGEGGRDMFGTVWAATEDTGWQLIPDPRKAPVLEDICDWREVIQFPDLDALDWETAAKRDLAGYDPEEKMLCVLGMSGNFDRLQALMGTENAMCAMIEDPEEVYAFFAAYTDYRCEIIRRSAQYYKPDIYLSGDDICTETGMYFSKEMHKELIRPFELQIGQTIVEQGMLFEQHCCGLCDDYLIEHFIDMKARIWQTAQSMNDLVHIQEKYGRKLLINGGWHTFGPAGMENATEAETRAEVRRCIDSYGKNGNYMLFPIIFSGDLEQQERRRAWAMDECRVYSEKYLKSNCTFTQ